MMLISTPKMHADEVDINTTLIKQLLLRQLPEWAESKLEIVHPAGSDNVMYRLGNDKVVRLPRTPSSAINLKKEISWLPQLEPHLPLAVPAPIAYGAPDLNYPFPWLISKWLEGENPNTHPSLDNNQAALELGKFISAMQKIDPTGAPKSTRTSLSYRDDETREAIALASNIFDSSLLTKLWNSALKAPLWKEDPVWIHGDLHPGNLLSNNGKITAILDFGLSGIGDPAVDLMVAWTLLTKKTRSLFRSVVKPDEATWKRARGWALTFGVVAYTYYSTRSPILAAIAKRTLDEVILEAKEA